MPRIRTHPGEILNEEYLLPLGLSARQVADAIGVPPNRISDLVRQRRGMTADTAIRLGRYFGNDPRFWLNMQQGYELSKAQAETDYSAVPTRAA
jgi:antitoxin HigA-1